MNEENTLNGQSKENTGGSSVMEILGAFRARWFIILIITAIFAIGGFVYSKLRLPIYTASVPVSFSMQVADEEVDDTDMVSSTNYLYAYLETAAEFCTSGVVIDRANFYYGKYLVLKNMYGMKIDDFIASLKQSYAVVKEVYNTEMTEYAHGRRTNKPVIGEIPGYEATIASMAPYKDKWFTSENVGTGFTPNKNNTTTQYSSVVFKLWAKNLNEEYAKEMVRIFAFSAGVAINVSMDLGDNALADFIELSNTTSGVSVSKDMNNRRTIIIAAFIGLILSILVVYIAYLADNTVKKSETLEEIIGVPVIAYIDDVAEEK